MAELPPFAKLVPGFDFLQSLMKGAGSALPGIGQWVAPTLNPEELEKRIEELRTVQFWLEQNAKMLGATIQALEVQRMTLSTLKTMNVPLDQIRDTLSIKPPVAAPEPVSAPPAHPKPARTRSRAAAPAAANPAAAMIDPMQWWGALTKQFTQLAATAVKDSATDAAKNLAGAVVKQGMEAAGDTLRKAAAMPVKAAQVATAAAGAATAPRKARGAASSADKAPTPRTRRSPSAKG
jgi:hypothetical protein